MRLKLTLGLLLALAGCATPRSTEPGAPVRVKIIGFNDFHGNLEPPRTTVSAPVDGAAEPVRVPAGGAAYFASAIAQLRAANPNNVTVAAGDMIGASPLVSSIFLDEPTIHAMNLMRVDYNAVGNHEFDRGRDELLRIQRGGCEKNTLRDPCKLEPFGGARFGILAANVFTEKGETLFPAYGIRSFGKGARQVRVAFIGMTTRDTPTLVTPEGVKGLEFRDEAETVNALVPKLKAEGADAIVVVIHQGAFQPGGRLASRDEPAPPVPGCGTMEGDLMPILARLDPEVDLVVSGHTHNSYICDYSTVDPARRFLVTSAGRYGTQVTDIELSVDPARGVLSRTARNLIVQGEGYRSGSTEVVLSDVFPAYPKDRAVDALVSRYAAAAAPLAARVVGRITGPATRQPSPAGETSAGDLVADAQLAATAAPGAGGAQIAFMNGYGVRADIVPGPDGSVTYGQIYAAQPFGNSLAIKSLTGAQLRRLLEQQFSSGSNTVERPNMLMPSRGLTYSYDLRKTEGQRIIDLRLNGQPIRDDSTYRVAMNSFLATGGDNFTVFREGTDTLGGPQDLDAFEAYLAASGQLAAPTPNRITRLDPPPAR
ncbi:MAG TPA: bifunctional metallophosphatase/5'-nucleotidase [Allosphingosinicella sp.]|jgi:5'-nucleotidase